MNPFEVILRGDFLIDSLGVAGLGLAALAALRLARRYRSWGGSLLAGGAALLLLGRLWVLTSRHFFTPELRLWLGDNWMAVLDLTPMALLTTGLAGVVWGLWGHEQWLRAER